MLNRQIFLSAEEEAGPSAALTLELTLAVTSETIKLEGDSSSYKRCLFSVDDVPGCWLVEVKFRTEKYNFCYFLFYLISSVILLIWTIMLLQTFL